ncbi:MAG TPA: glycosyltransferase [bacterium]|nr:glycosyltransferase [bacterium]
MLSIIIPTLNEQDYLSLLIESIKKQEIEDLEIIVSDAGSKDKTIEIAKDYNCNVVKGGLPAKGKNEGVRYAKGNLLLFLDADTMLLKDSLKGFLKEFKERKLDIAVCLVEPFKKNIFSNLYYNIFFNLPPIVLERIYPNGVGFILIRKDIHEKINGFNEEIVIGEDHHYLRKASKIGKCRVLRSSRILFSERRPEKEGWFKLIFRYILMSFYTIFFGTIKSGIFKYKFGNFSKKKKD